MSHRRTCRTLAIDPDGIEQASVMLDIAEQRILPSDVGMLDLKPIQMGSILSREEDGDVVVIQESDAEVDTDPDGIDRKCVATQVRPLSSIEKNRENFFEIFLGSYRNFSYLCTVKLKQERYGKANQHQDQKKLIRHRSGTVRHGSVIDRSRVRDEHSVLQG